MVEEARIVNTFTASAVSEDVIAIEKVTEAAVRAVNDNALSGLEHKIENKIVGSVIPALNSNNCILLSGYSRLEQELILVYETKNSVKYSIVKIAYIISLIVDYLNQAYRKSQDYLFLLYLSLLSVLYNTFLHRK